MKYSILLIALTFLLTACTNNSNAEFEKNTAIAKAFFELHENEDFDQMLTYLHEDMTWHLPGYGMGMGGIEEVKAAILGYHAAFDNMKFEADYWLPGVNTETGLPDGSTRVYGTWISTHTASGKEARLTSYHAFEFKDGKIINGGDWFDLGGMMNALQVEMAEENEEITEN
jgi:ketosteroid isomerase-like protein